MNTTSTPRANRPPVRAGCGRLGSGGAHRRLASARVAGLALWLACASAGASEASPWFDAARPSAQARQAVQMLSAAESHGLSPHDYEADKLQQALQRAAQGPPLAASAAADLGRALGAAMRAYLLDLHQGRVRPQEVGADFKPPRPDAFDAEATLQRALAAARLPDAEREAQPPLSQYQRLREALARYRALDGHAAWQAPLPPLPRQPRGAAKLEAGQAYDGLAVLAQRLVALGDLAADADLPALYEGPLVDAVTVLQRRHGLAADGVIGRATWAALQVAPAARVRQIELALERLRWTPLLEAPRMVVVNIPEFVLRAYEVHEGRIEVRREMKVIVGKAMDTRTPLLVETLRFIEFSPYWNVPPSIARGEVVPQLRRDPAAFARLGYEFVAPDGQVHAALSADWLDAVREGRARIRQRPGPRNALGDIKFVFPNRASIYLHHTPATALFGRERRDFSHGCIRVAEPVALALFALQGMPQWTEARIRQAMEKGESATLRLAEPVPVLIAYGTTLVKGGRIHFFDDIYGHDRRLDAALRKRVPTVAALPERS